MDFKDIRLHTLILLEKSSNKSHINQLSIILVLAIIYLKVKFEIYFEVSEIQDFKILKYERG